MATILIVEDEAPIAHVLSVWLRQHGYTVALARNGQEALELLSTTAVDLIVSDMNMPVMDGLTLVRTLRKERGLSLPFLLLSARCDQAQLAADLKPFDVQLYPKPFMPSRLVSEIEKALSAVTS